MIRNSYRQTAHEELCRHRRALSRTSVQAFADLYLAHYMKQPPSPMHIELFRTLDELTTQRGRRIAIAAPREHAKSTVITLAYLLYCICHGLEPCITILSDTFEQAADHLSHIKHELQTNPRIASDFPEVAEIEGLKPGSPRWRKSEIITRNDVKVAAFGADQNVRGRRHREHRPSLIICDDLENENNVRSPDRRHYLETWFNRAVLKSGSAETNVIVVGTILHFDSLLAKLVDPLVWPGWEGRKYQAVVEWSHRQDLWQLWEAIYCRLDDYEGELGQEAASRFLEANREAMMEGVRVLWPQRDPYERLMLMRVREGRASFDAEKQNEPINPDECLFQESDFHYWDDEYDSADELIRNIGKHGSFYGACDPSLGKKGRRGDDSAIITLLRDNRDGVLYVIDADIRRRRPDEIIDTIIEYHRLRHYRLFAIETVQFQEFLATELLKRSIQQGAGVPIRKINPTTDKIGRIQSLQPMITSGKIRFSRRHTQLLDQLRQFPLAAHDDGPDALEMAYRVSRHRSRKLRFIDL